MIVGELSWLSRAKQSIFPFFLGAIVATVSFFIFYKKTTVEEFENFSNENAYLISWNFVLSSELDAFRNYVLQMRGLSNKEYTCTFYDNPPPNRRLYKGKINEWYEKMYRHSEKIKKEKPICVEWNLWETQNYGSTEPSLNM